MFVVRIRINAKMLIVAHSSNKHPLLVPLIKEGCVWRPDIFLCSLRRRLSCFSWSSEDQVRPHMDYVPSSITVFTRRGVRDCRSPHADRLRQPGQENQDTIWHLRRLNGFLLAAYFLVGNVSLDRKLHPEKCLWSVFLFFPLLPSLFQMNDSSSNL